MILNGSFLGYSILQSQPALPQPIAYNKITLYGGNTIVDKVHIRNIELTQSEIQSINPNHAVSWGANTILLSQFDESTLDAGNIINLPSALTGWQIYRKEVGSNISTFLAEVSAGSTFYIDYTVGAYRNYIYEIFPVTDDEIGNPIVTTATYSDFFGWYLMNYEDSDVVYRFDLNLSSDQIENDTDVTVHNTYTKKPSISIGDRDSIKGSINCWAGSINSNGQFEQGVDYLDQLREFINNKKPKLLKSRKGHVWKVGTYGMSQKFQDEIGEQPVQISFNFVEIE